MEHGLRKCESKSVKVKVYNLKTFKVGLMTMQDFQGRTFKTFKVGIMTMQDGTRIAAPNTYNMHIGNMVTITLGSSIVLSIQTAASERQLNCTKSYKSYVVNDNVMLCLI